MALLLSCDGLSKAYGARRLFSGISLGVFEEEKVGLIGPNGSGKSTLLKILVGEEPADDGEVSVRRQLRLGYIPQEDVFPAGATVEEVLLEAARTLPMDEHERYVQVDIMLGKMEFAQREQVASTLSGGWRKRLAIARALIQQPELLLLDEPTNHLDIEGILWLEKLLKSAPFGFVLVSHDRYLLENVTTRVVELSRTYPDGYFSITGSYSDFLAKREEFLSGQAGMQQALTAKVRQEVEWLQRGARARTTKAKGRIEAAERLIEELDETRERNAQTRAAVQIDFTGTGRRTKKLMAVKGMSKNLGGRPLFRDLDLLLTSGMKLGLLGPNGSGKTTLLRLLTGDLQPDAGEVWTAEGLRVVFFEQTRASLDKSVTLRRALAPNSDTLDYRGQPIHVAGWAKKFLFDPDQLPLPVSELSGGEQSRILIARLMLQPADVLILDEPTNDLDIPSLEVLEESLSDFPGTLILVTHDRYLLDRLCTELLALEGDGVVNTYAEFAQWERTQQAEKPTPPRSAPAPKPAPAKAPARAKALTWKEERELEGMEESILAAEEAVATLLQRMQDPSIATDHLQLHALSTEHHQAEEQVRQLYARWEELEAKRESGAV